MYTEFEEKQHDIWSSLSLGTVGYEILLFDNYIEKSAKINFTLAKMSLTKAHVLTRTVFIAWNLFANYLGGTANDNAAY